MLDHPVLQAHELPLQTEQLGEVPPALEQVRIALGGATQLLVEEVDLELLDICVVARELVLVGHILLYSSRLAE